MGDSGPRPELLRLQVGVDRRGDRAAAAVAQHDHHPDAVAERVERKVDAAHAHVAQHVAGHANHEQIVETLAEEHFGRHAGIGAADDDGERGLLGHLALRANHAHFQAVARHDVARLAFAGGAGAAALHPPREHAVAVFQDSSCASSASSGTGLADGFLGSNR